MIHTQDSKLIEYFRIYFYITNYCVNFNVELQNSESM